MIYIYKYKLIYILKSSHTITIIIFLILLGIRCLYNKVVHIITKRTFIFPDFPIYR